MGTVGYFVGRGVPGVGWVPPGGGTGVASVGKCVPSGNP